MACDLSQNELHGYLDGELDAVRAGEFETHLEHCAECVAALEANESMRRSLQGAQLYQRAPDALRKKVHARLRLPEQIPLTPRQISWPWMAAVAAVALLALVGWQFVPGLRGPDQHALIASEIMDAHLRSLQPGHLIDVISTDQHTVKPWFDGKLNFAPPVVDFSGQGFPLQGGRLDVIHGRTVAAVVYARRKHFVSVFLWPASEQLAPPPGGTLQGYHWLSWQKDGMVYSAVSDVSNDDLIELQRLLEK